MSEKVDVLLATYNGEKYVKEQIDSILGQTYQNIHLIISDDCSSDSTREILKQYENKKNVTIYYQEKNLGLIKNFEFLMQQVTNNLYMLSDQDDIWLPEKIEKSIETLEKENVDLVFGDLEVVDENMNTIYPSFGDYMLLNKKIKKYINSYKVNYLYNCVTGCTILSKKKFIPMILPFPTESKYVIHDFWLGTVMAIHGKLAYVEKPYIKYRQHGGNLVGTDKISHGFKKMDEVRKLFINVKLGVFGTYVKRQETFPKTLQDLNKKALTYYEMLSQKKNFNFRNWEIFHQLYKTETFIYYIENFIILNMPFLGRGLFKIRHGILKLLGKR